MMTSGYGRRVIAIVPAHNEATVIGQVIHGLLPFVDEAIVIDDGSKDNTSAVAEAAGAVVLRHNINRGQGAALETGMAAALNHGATVIVHFDGDGQHDPSDIPTLLAPLDEHRADVVLGSRFLGNAPDLPFTRRITLKLGILFMWFFSGLRLSDPQSGLRAFSRRAAEGLIIRHDGMAHASEILDQIAAKRLRFVEVPATVHYTDYSLKRGQKSSAAFAIVWRLIRGKFFLPPR